LYIYFKNQDMVSAQATTTARPQNSTANATSQVASGEEDDSPVNEDLLEQDLAEDMPYEDQPYEDQPYEDKPYKKREYRQRY
jgi:hypothetical protein